MAQIKCRYTTAYCNYMNKGVDVNDYWICDSNEECPVQHYVREENARPNVINPKCRYYELRHIELTKNYKSYKYDHDGLRVGRTFISADDIEFLEIDGRVLIDEENLIC